MKKRDFIIISLQDWDQELGCNIKNIAAGIAKENRVIFVEMPMDTRTLFKDTTYSKKRYDILLKKRKWLEQINQNLWVLNPPIVTESVNWISNPYLFDKLNRRNSRRIAARISQVAEELGFKDFVLLMDNEFIRSQYFMEYLKPDVSIYYMRDFFNGIDFWKRHGERLEPEIIRKCDLAVTNSLYYKDYCAQFNPNSYFIGQGVDVSHFQPQNVKEQPADLRDLKGPVIGYVGVLYSVRLNINIIEKIAESKPDWNIVLVGKEDDVFEKSRLHEMSNVHFLGFKEFAQLPAYINSFDVCINPQKLNEVTIGNYPLKIDEYLAMGKPVVATRTRAMEFFEPHVYLAETAEEYIRFIEKALAEDDSQKQQERRNFAGEHTWENNVKAIYKAFSIFKDNEVEVN